MSMLQARVRSAPALLGSTVWGMTDIHKVLRSLAPAQKDKPQPLYFVKVNLFNPGTSDVFLSPPVSDGLTCGLG